MMGVIFSTLDYLVYSLPAAFIVFWLRESLRSYIHLKMGSSAPYSSLFYIDIIAVSSMSLFGISWGGLVNQDREDNWFTALSLQFFYLFFFLIIFIYLRLNNSTTDSYLFQVIGTMAKQVYILFLLNFLPIPPFDFSFFYMQNLQHSFYGKLGHYFMKFVVLVILYFNLVNTNFFGVETIYQFIVPG